MTPSFAQAPTYTWNSGEVPVFDETTVVIDQDETSGSVYTYLAVDGSASGQLNNFTADLTLKKTSNSTTPQLSLIDIFGKSNVEFGGSSLNLSITTDIAGGGNDMVDAFFLGSSNASTVISADTTNITVKTTDTNGKSAYGIAADAGKLFLTGSQVNINVETATDRDETNYSESIGLDVSGAQVCGSANAVMNVNMVSSGSNETGKFEDHSNSDYNGNWWGASPVTAVKLEGGSLVFEGTINATVSANAGNATGLAVTNYFATTENGQNWNNAAGKINNFNATVSSQSGRAAGISVEYVPDETSDKTNVILVMDGVSNISVSTEEGEAYGIYMDGETKVDVKNNMNVVATAGENRTAYSLSVNEGSLSLNGASNSLTGDVKLTGGSEVKFANGTTTIDGNVTSEDSSSIDVNNATIDLAEGNTLQAEKFNSTKGTVRLSSTAEDTIRIDELTGDELNVVASSRLGNQFASVQDAAKALGDSITIVNEAGTSTDVILTGEESDILGSWQVGANGEVIARENTKLASMRGLNAVAFAAWRDEVAYTNQRMEYLRDHSHAYGAWAQVYGGESSYEDKTDLKTTTIQVGADTAVGNWVIGATFSYMNGDADLVRGTADTDAYTLALYGERRFDSGLFVNGLARYGRLSTDAKSGNMDSSYDNNAFSVGGNVGFRFNFAQQAFVEPTFGLQYAYVMGDDYKASNGVKVEQDNFDALIASLGSRVGFNFPKDAGKIFARVSVNHDFLGEIDGKASNGIAVDDMYVDLGGTWVSYGVGMQFNVTDSLSVWGNADRTTGGDVSTNYMLNAGIRYVF
ncbi:putative uncharacterized protein [Sutterella sp. CAG:521]|nr:putative uncharacterized protein [Sutterella sp. CAG:521]